MSRALQEIERSDPLKDHKRIVFLSSSYEFPFDIARARVRALPDVCCPEHRSSFKTNRGIRTARTEEI